VFASADLNNSIAFTVNQFDLRKSGATVLSLLDAPSAQQVPIYGQLGVFVVKLSKRNVTVPKDSTVSVSIINDIGSSIEQYALEHCVAFLA
jgi:hypothetical protein